MGGAASIFKLSNFQISSLKGPKPFFSPHVFDSSSEQILKAVS